MDENDLRRRARKTGFNVATLEKDYALTWLLIGIYLEDSKLRYILIFKGGTAIRKIYFSEWRLSEDIPEFEVLVYSPNDILVEKLRSILQRGKARDYYDVWRLMKEKEFNLDLIFDENRLSEAKKFWTISLARLTKNLPDFESVVNDLRLMLDFIKVK